MRSLQSIVTSRPSAQRERSSGPLVKSNLIMIVRISQMAIQLDKIARFASIVDCDISVIVKPDGSYSLGNHHVMKYALNMTPESLALLDEIAGEMKNRWSISDNKELAWNYIMNFASIAKSSCKNPEAALAYIKEFVLAPVTKGTAWSLCDHDQRLVHMASIRRLDGCFQAEIVKWLENV